MTKDDFYVVGGIFGIISSYVLYKYFGNKEIKISSNIARIIKFIHKNYKYLTNVSLFIMVLWLMFNGINDYNSTGGSCIISDALTEKGRNGRSLFCVLVSMFPIELINNIKILGNYSWLLFYIVIIFSIVIIALIPIMMIVFNDQSYRNKKQIIEKYGESELINISHSMFFLGFLLTILTPLIISFIF